MIEKSHSRRLRNVQDPCLDYSQFRSIGRDKPRVQAPQGVHGKSSYFSRELDFLSCLLEDFWDLELEFSGLVVP